MSQPASNPGKLEGVKMLPGGDALATAGKPISASTAPARQLQDLPKDELEHFAEEFGLDPHDYRTRQALVAGIHERRQLIAAMDREAMLDIVRWGRRPVPVNISKEDLAREIVRIHTMRFSGLSHRGLLALARLRGARVNNSDPVPLLIRRLKKQEGFFTRLNRKRRAWLGSMVANMIGEAPQTDYRFLPPTQQGAVGGAPLTPDSATIRDDIEEAGLIGGIASRVRKSADSYLNQKLDEIEARIDRKLDEIDRRLAEWRDKEIANRIRILKVTLWVSVIVGAFSLIYKYFEIYIIPMFRS